MQSSMKKFFEKLNKHRKKATAAVSTAALLLMAQVSHAAPATGSDDLDTLIGSMETGATSMKTGGMYIIGFVILIAVVLFGAKWLWGLFRGWMSQAK